MRISIWNIKADFIIEGDILYDVERDYSGKVISSEYNQGFIYLEVLVCVGGSSESKYMKLEPDKPIGEHLLIVRERNLDDCYG